MPNDMTAPASAPAKDPQPTNFPAMLKAFLPEIQRALPKHMDGDRMARIALTAFRSTPTLAKCDPISVFAAVIQSAQLGLEVGLMGEAHMVPFRTKDGWKVQLIPGYQGLMKLARNSGLINDIYVHEVRERDEFALTFGLERSLIHQPLTEHGFPAGDEVRGKIVGFYAVAVFKDGSKTFAAMSKHDVDKIRDGSKGYKSSKAQGKESLWDTDYLSMGLKTAIRRLSKYLPKSPELAAALALDNMAERGKDQHIELKDAIEGNWAPATDDPDDPPEGEASSGKGEPAKLPELAAEEFDANLKKWREIIAKKKKTADEIIATAQTKNTLTEAQIAAIRGSPDDPAPPEALTLMRSKAQAGEISDADVMKFLKVKTLDGLTVAQVDRALAFIADPAGASK